MARRERIYLPMGFGGLIRYSEKERGFIKLKPQHVIIGIILLVVVEIILRVFFPY
jgi:preprotein translocase subunit Sec61beta